MWSAKARSSGCNERRLTVFHEQRRLIVELSAVSCTGGEDRAFDVFEGTIARCRRRCCLKSLEAEFAVFAIEDLDESIGDEDQDVAGLERHRAAGIPEVLNEPEGELGGADPCGRLTVTRNVQHRWMSRQH